MIVVSNRGPFRFAQERRRHVLARTAARAASSARSCRCSANREDATWVAAAISEDDRAAVRGRDADADRRRARPAARRSTRSISRLHYDVVSNGVLWFLHHGLFDLARRPRFDRRFREAWEGYVAVNRVVHRRGGRRRRPTARPCSCRTTSSRSCPQMLARRAAPTSTSCTSPTRRSAVRARSACSPSTSPTRSAASMASGTTGFHTERWARAFRASAREVLGADAGDRPHVRGVVRTRSRGARGRGRDARGRRRDRRARGARRRPAAHRAQRPHGAVEEHRARLPRLRPACSRSTRSCASGSRSPRC